jgi:hypothetical protein
MGQWVANTFGITYLSSFAGCDVSASTNFLLSSPTLGGSKTPLFTIA